MQDRQLCNVEVFGEPNWRQVMTCAIFRLMWLPFKTFVQPWWPMVTTFWRPWRPMVKTVPRPWWLLVKTVRRLLWAWWLPCDYSPWRHWWPMWQHWRPCAHNWLWPSDKKDDKVTTKMTDDREWRCGKFKWWTMWLLLTTPDNPSDDQNMTPRTLTTLDEYHWQSMWWPGDDTHNFLDDIWRLHLEIFIIKVKSCLSCWHTTEPIDMSV